MTDQPEQERRHTVGRRASDVVPLTREARDRARYYALPAWVGPTLAAVTVLNALARSHDYAYFARVHADAALYEGVRVIGYRAWSVIFLTLAVLILFTLVVRAATGWYRPQMFAHVLGCAVYAAFAVAIAEGVLGQPAGLRYGAAAASGGVIHFCLVATLHRRLH